jgi:putative glutamine amidotransferase
MKSTRPVIGIPTQTLHAMDGIPENLPPSWVMNQRYFMAVTSVGGVPWMIPLLDEDLDTLREIYQRLDGILLPGGVDMDPRTYGEALNPECGRIDPARDRVELQLTKWAIEDEKPILGLCRGIQVINVALGGSLYQDLGADLGGAIKHDYFPTQGFAREFLAHEVRVEQGSRFGRLLEQPSVKVNSMHHQGLKKIGAGLNPVAVAPDGLVEAVEGSARQFLIGVQWHPEVLTAAGAHPRQLFEAFIGAASR